MKKILIVQDLFFDEEKFETKRSIRNWCERNGYRCDKLKDIKHLKSKKQYRVRQNIPSKFIKSSIKTIKISKYITSVKGRIKK